MVTVCANHHAKRASYETTRFDALLYRSRVLDLNLRKKELKVEVEALNFHRIFCPAKMALSSRIQGIQKAKASRMKPKQRKCYGSRTAPKTLEMARREFYVAHRQAALVERDPKLVHREGMVSAKW